ncbi:hypothetical protein DCAR_0312047 [Daucus carota subsp. sativus]|uniref:Uncharacterized protein n=1 Tax=Daucus carota subsp. sativus TaxID=79200 RepID=A0A169W9H6_DAUCS|nr:PREDICTED: protein ABIL2 [Daucus carota subsp. sativus]XP_017241373.1 PREDICTED: protein ABIL2 [Daucus carota subsp. sativus]XP_017241374.1 PREDICTED: protein ABIL2 [Daucus carota subsp. sativus]WOG92771.1 hypothetical protein DCAR_0312047 [Daucus carota subsp. sativus]
METMASASASIRLPPEPANYDEVSMHQSLLFSNSLEDLKNLRNQLYLAAKYFEKSFTNDGSKQIAVDALKAYTIKALVSTVDHLGSVSYKVNDLLSEKIDEVSVTDIRVSQIEQRLRTCQTYIDREGLSQQSLVISTPKHHKHYILPVGTTMHGGNKSKAKYEGCNLDDQDDWRELKNAIRATVTETPTSSFRRERSPSPSTPSQQHQSLIISGNVSKRHLEKRTVSPHRFPLLRFGSFSSRPASPNSRSGTPNSRSTTPNLSRPTTPNLRQGYLLESRKSVSMRHNVDGENFKVSDHIPSKSKRLLKALLTKRRLKKDDTLYTYLDEY